jgi:hypothetical protein
MNILYMDSVKGTPINTNMEENHESGKDKNDDCGCYAISRRVNHLASEKSEEETCGKEERRCEMNEIVSATRRPASGISDYQVLNNDGNFLVIDITTGEYEEVQQGSEGMECECFLSQVSPDHHCGHLEAVTKHLIGKDEPQLYDQERADYFLSKIAYLDAEIEQNQMSAKVQVDRISAWLESETSKLEKKKLYFLNFLEDWMRSNQYSSKNLVNGKLNIRKQPVQIEVVDEKLLLKDSRFCRVIPEKLTADKRALRKHVLDTGEEIPGTVIAAPPSKFSYKLHEEV